MKQTFKNYFYLLCYALIGLSIVGIYHENNVANERKLERADRAIERAHRATARAKQALSDERLSRYLECGDRPICDERWPDATKVVAEAKAKVKAREDERALRKKAEELP